MMMREVVLLLPKDDDNRLRGVYYRFCQNQALANGSARPSYSEFLVGLIDTGLRGLVSEVMADKLARDGVEPPTAEGSPS